MAIQEFIAFGKTKAIKKAVIFWNETLRDQLTLVEFLACCEWIEEDGKSKLTFDDSRLND